MRPFLIALAVLPLAAAPAVAQDGESDSKVIIVTGTPLSDTAAALRDCIARKCPPDEDIKASLRHAENQFVAGDYRDSRYTLAKSLGRNSGEEKRFPVEVADLWRANGRIGAHLGEADIYRLSTLEMRDALKAGLPDSDLRILNATLEIGDMRARLGYPDEADAIYKRVAKQARAQGNAGLAAFAELRGAWLYTQTGDKDTQPENNREARKRLTAFAARPESEIGKLGFSARVLLARLDRDEGKKDASAAILAEYAAQGGTTRPTLLFAAPIKQPDTPYEGGQGEQRNVLSQLATKNFEERWVDIGFWITPPGRVSEAEIIRGSHKDVHWTKPVLTALGSRIYAPLKLDAGDPGYYHIERYTYTSHMEDRLGTRIRQRSAIPRIEQLDLTPDQIASAPPRSGG